MTLILRTNLSPAASGFLFGGEVTGMTRRILVMLAAVMVLTAGCAAMIQSTKDGDAATVTESKTAADLAKDIAARPSL